MDRAKVNLLKFSDKEDSFFIPSSINTIVIEKIDKSISLCNGIFEKNSSIKFRFDSSSIVNCLFMNVSFDQCGVSKTYFINCRFLGCTFKTNKFDSNYFISCDFLTCNNIDTEFIGNHFINNRFSNIEKDSFIDVDNNRILYNFTFNIDDKKEDDNKEEHDDVPSAIADETINNDDVYEDDDEKSKEELNNVKEDGDLFVQKFISSESNSKKDYSEKVKQNTVDLKSHENDSDTNEISSDNQSLEKEIPVFQTDNEIEDKDLSDVLDGKNYSKCLFRSCKIENQNLSEFMLNINIFKDSTFINIDFLDIIFDESQFFNCQFINCEFNRCSFVDCIFEDNCNIVGTFRACVMYQTDIKCSMEEIQFEKTDYLATDLKTQLTDMQNKLESVEHQLELSKKGELDSFNKFVDYYKHYFDKAEENDNLARKNSHLEQLNEESRKQYDDLLQNNTLLKTENDDLARKNSQLEQLNEESRKQYDDLLQNNILLKTENDDLKEMNINLTSEENNEENSLDIQSLEAVPTIKQGLDEPCVLTKDELDILMESILLTYNDLNSQIEDVKKQVEVHQKLSVKDFYQIYKNEFDFRSQNYLHDKINDIYKEIKMENNKEFESENNDS